MAWFGDLPIALSLYPRQPQHTIGNGFEWLAHSADARFIVNELLAGLGS